MSQKTSKQKVTTVLLVSVKSSKARGGGLNLKLEDLRVGSSKEPAAVGTGTRSAKSLVGMFD